MRNILVSRLTVLLTETGRTGDLGYRAPLLVANRLKTENVSAITHLLRVVVNLVSDQKHHRVCAICDLVQSMANGHNGVPGEFVVLRVEVA